MGGGAGIILILHGCTTWFLTGLVWFVQVVHYPLMSRVGREQFPAYEQAHTQQTTWVVAPAMLVELGSGLSLLWFYPALWAWLNLLFIALIWLSTFFIQVPLHNRLTGAFQEEWHRQLVRSNWLRTFLWSVRAVGVVVVANGL